ncbi:uncharacterized protein LOC143934609 [Lithobates pipiens]
MTVEDQPSAVSPSTIEGEQTALVPSTGDNEATPAMTEEDQPSAVSRSTIEGEQTALVSSTSDNEATPAMTVEDLPSAVSPSTIEGKQTALVSSTSDNEETLAMTVEDQPSAVSPSTIEGEQTALVSSTSDEATLAITVEDQPSTVSSSTIEGEQTALVPSTSEIKLDTVNENQQNSLTPSNGEVENKFWASFANFIKQQQPPKCKISKSSPLVPSYLGDKMSGQSPPSSIPTMNKKTSELVPSCSIRKVYAETFTFHKELGEGSFGKVVLATHPATDQKLAVKFISKRKLLRFGPYMALTERWILEEGRECPYITHIYGSFQTNNHLAFVMEYLSGGDLSDLIRNSAPLPLDTLRNLTAEIIWGLQFLHDKDHSQRSEARKHSLRQRWPRQSC